MKKLIIMTILAICTSIYAAKRTVHKAYHPNGMTSHVSQMANGMKHGMTTKYYPDGTIKRTTRYSRNIKHGIDTKYRPDGSTLSVTRYKRDFPVSHVCVTTDGRELHGSPQMRCK